MEGLGTGEITFTGGQRAFAIWLGYDNRSLLSVECCGSWRREMKDIEQSSGTSQGILFYIKASVFCSKCIPNV